MEEWFGEVTRLAASGRGISCAAMEWFDGQVGRGQTRVSGHWASLGCWVKGDLGLSRPRSVGFGYSFGLLGLGLIGEASLDVGLKR